MRQKFTVRFYQYLVVSTFLLLLQMTVVEAYICGKKIDSPDNSSQLPPKVASLLIEGIAQNTTGSVFMSEVSEQDVCFPFILIFGNFHHLDCITNTIS